MIEIVEIASAGDLADLRRDYLASLTAPLDGMWETFAAMGRHLELRSTGIRAGYLALDESGRVLQFHVPAPFARVAAELFAAVVARNDVRGAMVSTADPLFLGVCLDVHRSLRVHTLLYQDHDRGEIDPPDGSGATFEVVVPGELEAIADFQRDSLEQDPGGWLVGYLSGLIERQELLALRLGEEILATGEARVSDSQPPFADLGVITSRHQRRRGLASRVLGRLKRRCRERDLVPICSTTVENVGARRAIAKAGFVSRHRILEIGF